MKIHSFPFQYGPSSPELKYTCITFDNFPREKHSELWDVLQTAPNARWNRTHKINQDVAPIFETYQTDALLQHLRDHNLDDVAKKIVDSYQANLAKAQTRAPEMSGHREEEAAEHDDNQKHGQGPKQ
jgi:hypothetical protein